MGKERPNLLFVITDQEQALATEGPARLPALDRLRARGVSFSRAYTVNAICSPARASILTGVLPHAHGMVDCTHTVEDYRARFRPDLPTWSGILKGSGYRTAYYGKWHVERSEKLDDFGFDEYDVVGRPEVNERRRRHGLPEKKAVERRVVVTQKGYRDYCLCGVTDEPEEVTFEHYVFSKGEGFIREAKGPWCLVVGTQGPHDPYVVPRRYREMYDPSAIERPMSFRDDFSSRPRIYERARGVWRSLSWDDFAEAIACYYGFCTMIDGGLGRLLRALEETGQLEETVIVFTTDHGDFMGAHGMFLKGVPAFEEVYRVPLVVSAPNCARGESCPALVTTMDLAPTLSEFCTGERMEGVHGRSLVPLLRAPGSLPAKASSLRSSAIQPSQPLRRSRPAEDGSAEAGDWPEEAFAEFHGQRFFYTQRVLWRGSWKYVFNGFDMDELYDLASDPHEMRNLAADPDRAGVLEEMSARMWEITRATGDHNMFNAQYPMFRFAPTGPEG